MADIFEIVENNGNPKKIGDSKSRTNTAEEFANNKAYAKGDIVMYDGNLYEFKVAHSVGSWDLSQVEQTNLGNKITEAKILIIEFSTLSATTGTLVSISNSKIKSYTQPLPILNLQHPQYQLDDWTINVADNGGLVYITGTASDTGTKGKIYLVNPQ